MSDNAASRCPNAIELRSAIPGRERWTVPAIRRKAQLAAEIEKGLAQLPGIFGVIANPNSARVLVRYAAEHRPDIPALLAQQLAEASSRLRNRIAPEPPSAPLRRILQLSLPPARQLAAPVLLSAVGTGLSILGGVSIVATINTALGRGPKFLDSFGPRTRGGRLSFMMAISALVSTVNMAAQYRRKRSWRVLALSTRHRLRTELLAHLETQDMAFFDRHGTGRLIHIASQDTAQIGEFVEQAGDGLIERTMTIGFGTAVLLRSSPRLALISALPLPLFLMVGRFFRQRVTELYSRAAQMSMRYSQALENNFAGIPEVKSFTAEQREARRLETTEAALQQAAFEAAQASSLQSHIARWIFGTGYCFTAGIGGRLVAAGKMQQVEYNAAMYWVPQILSALTGIDESIRLYHAATQSARQLAQTLDAKPEIRDGARHFRKKRVRGEIEFQDVSFSYVPSVTVLDNISLQLKAGQTLGIAGSTGSGKSTLLRLLLRLYDVQAGRLMIDGLDVRELNLHELRSAISFVSQDVYLFQGTVRQNILYGRPGASLAEVREVMREAGALELLESLPGGLDAEVGERGQRLSGGERQRLALARALLKQAPILALDEPTSHLDYESEALVKQSLRSASQGRTVILIAHRLSTIRDADQIIMLEKGRIGEQGTHEQLVRRRGLYASMWRLQSGKR